MEEEQKRKQVFAESLREVLEHNARAVQGLHTFDMGINQFSDMTLEEFQQTNFVDFK